MTSLRATIVTAVILAFGAGVAIGALINRPTATSSDETYVEGLEDRYGLDDTQLARIRSHLAEEERRIETILSGVEEQVKEDIRGVRADVQQQIRGELSEAQQQAFDRDIAGS